MISRLCLIKKNLETIRFSGSGYLPAITISKRENNYELLDPIILSSQFKSKIKYTNVACTQQNNEDEDQLDIFLESSVSKNNKITWTNIPLDTEYLSFRATAKEGNFNYEAYQIKLPIRWVE